MRREHEFRYSRLANTLREQILSGFIKPGEFLMSENELCKYYGISRTSVRKSLEQLQKEGLIVKKVGQGTIVSPDLVIPASNRRSLRIVAVSPSHYVDNCLGTIIDAFQERYPQVEVKLLHFPAFNFWDSLRSGEELGLIPDLVLVTDRGFAESDRHDLFVDPNEQLGDLTSEFYPRILDPFRVDGVLRAVPGTFSPVFLAYNPQLFARYNVPEPRAGWSRDDMIEAARRLTLDLDQDGIVDLYGLSLSSAWSRWPVIALQNGFRFDASSGRRPLVETLRFFHDALYRERVATLYQSSRSHINLDAFPREKAAMVLTTLIELAGWRSEGMPFAAKIAPLPFGPVKSTLLVSNVFMIRKDCQDPELAHAFLRIAFEEELQSKLARNTGFLSCLPRVNESVWDNGDLAALHIAGSQIENGYFLGELLGYAERIEELDAEMELYWAGLESAESMADRMLHILSE